MADRPEREYKRDVWARDIFMLKFLLLVNDRIYFIQKINTKIV